MNLNAYDIVEISPFTSHVDVQFKRLYTCDIKYHSFYSFLSRYNRDENKYDLFILVTDIQNNPELKYHSTIGNKDSKRLIFNIQPIFNNFKPKHKFNFKVYIEEYDKQSDGIIYKINY